MKKINFGSRGSGKTVHSLAAHREKILAQEEEKILNLLDQCDVARRNYHLTEYNRIKKRKPELLMHNYCLSRRVHPSDYYWLCNKVDESPKNENDIL